MSVELMEITARSKGGPADLSAISDFSLRPAGEIPEADLLRSPDWTLYCLDFPSKQALFVELSPSTDLSEAAFAYAHQFTAAGRAAHVAFDRFVATSEAIAAPSKLAFLFSTGRRLDAGQSHLRTAARDLEPVRTRLPDQPRGGAPDPCARRDGCPDPSRHLMDLPSAERAHARDHRHQAAQRGLADCERLPAGLPGLAQRLPVS